MENAGDPSPETTERGGLSISTTDTIRSLMLSSLSTDDNLLLQPSIPYTSLRSIWFSSDPSTRPELLSLLRGSTLIFPSPKPREKSEELKVRLRKLEEVAERKAYDELVKDITPRKGVEEPFSSYKDQLGFGLHVVLTMFTGYLVGYAAFRALFGHSPVMNAAGGILGLVVGMLVETLLFIVRASTIEKKSTFTTSQAKKNQ
ncbi:ATPase, vacuolar ER assembly factor, Vma [Heracleum sosnowskyi]|uniref:ATPase, vacuolar ER assembly factor, Vma n=1 Tax=Heracleum sosnowskyi TaxID=360622 RepID=A0AAD8HLE5_9APIA|nr:ATPase, vacuolar ER assembly factor, Vma [Heracleum sosnowskyi]